MSTTGFSGIDFTDTAVLTRDKESKAARFRIVTDNKWYLYAGPTVGAIDFTRPVAKGIGSHELSPDVPGAVRSYFQLITPQGRAVIAERHLPMTGGYNFRDLGGYRTKDGRYTKWGAILRSDDLHKLTDADLTYLSSVPLATVVDFRSQEEIRSAPDRLPDAVSYHSLSIAPGNLNAAAFDVSTLQEQQMDSLMMDMNRLFVTDSACIEQYRRYFDLLQQAPQGALLFHCSAGKDRTGMAAALTLYALGVDERTIMDDYLLSNRYVTDKYAVYIDEYPQLRPLFTVDAAYLRAGLREITDRYGSIESYLSGVLQVDTERLREMYLYPAAQ